MSTDMHAIVEVWRDETWYLGEPARWEPKVYFGHPDYTDLELRIPTFDLPQNYELFAILANIRNTRYELEPIVPPRGLPDDASVEARQLRDQNTGWMTCASWLLATELFSFDWSRTVATPEGLYTYAQLATRTAHPDAAALFTASFPKLRSYGDPDSVRILLFFY